MALAPLPAVGQRAPRPPDPKKEARKAPPLSMAPAWAVALPAPPSAAPAVDAARAYLTLRSAELVALDLADGKVAWSVPAPDVIAGPAAGGGLVFLPRAKEVQALDAGGATPRWQTPIDVSASVPLVYHGGSLVVASAGDALAMLRASTGEVLWKQPLGAAVAVRPAVSGNRVFVALDDARVAALALDSGKPLWAAKQPARSTTLSVHGDRVFVGSTDRSFTCLSADDGKTRWHWRTGGPIVGTTASDGDRVYFVSLDNVLRALDFGNGSQAWKASLPHRPNGGPFLTARLLLVPGFSAEVPAFQTLDGSTAGSAKLAGEPFAPPLLLPPAPDDKVGRLLAVTGEGQAQLLIPVLAPLPARAIPGLPKFTLPRDIAGGIPDQEGDVAGVRTPHTSTGAFGSASSPLTTCASLFTPSTIFSLLGSENESRSTFAPVPSTKKALPAT